MDLELLTNEDVHKSLKDLLGNRINSEFEGISGVNFKWLKNWSITNDMSEEQFYSGMSPSASKKPLTINEYFTNNDFNQIFVNIENYLSSNLDELPRLTSEIRDLKESLSNSENHMQRSGLINQIKKNYDKASYILEYKNHGQQVFEMIGEKGGSGLEHIVSNTLPYVIGNSILDLGLYAISYASITTKMRQLELLVTIESDDGYKIQTLQVSTLSGQITKEPAARYFKGKVNGILKHSSAKIHSIGFKFDASNGSFTIPVKFKDKRHIISSGLNIFRGVAKKLANIKLSSQKMKTQNTQKDLKVGINNQFLRTYDKNKQVGIDHKPTEEHSMNITQLSIFYGRAIGLSDDDLRVIALGGPTHDYGKRLVPERILLKKGKFNSEELFEMYSHAALGQYLQLHTLKKDLKITLPEESPSVIEKIIEDEVRASWLALDHQEGFDGSGYPSGRSNTEISLPGRILKFFDVFDAIMSKRVYKNANDVNGAINIMKKENYSEFDPEIFNHIAYGFIPFIQEIKNDEDLTKKLLGFYRGNIPLSELIKDSDSDIVRNFKIPEKLKDYVQSYKRPVFTTDPNINLDNSISLEGSIESSKNYFTGYFDKIKLVERIRLFREDYDNGVIRSTPENQSLYIRTSDYMSNSFRNLPFEVASELREIIPLERLSCVHDIHICDQKFPEHLKKEAREQFIFPNEVEYD